MGKLGSSNPNVERMEEKRDVKGLIKALKHKDFYVRRSAASALGRIGQSAAEPLIQALRNMDGDAQLEAVAALKWMGKAAVEPLIKALKDEDSVVRFYTVLVLREIGDARAAESLSKVLKDKDLRREAAEALIRLGEPAVEPLIQVLQDRDSDVRMEAVEALGKIGGSKVVEQLIKALKDEELPVRNSAAYALGKIGSARVFAHHFVIEPLIEVLKKDLSVRRTATEALIMIGEPAVEALTQALNDKDEKVRLYAKFALQTIEHKKSQDGRTQEL